MIIYFPHIPKAGGQTLLQGFYKAFGIENCIKVWNPDFGADVSAENFSSLNSEQFEGISAVVGHLPLSKFLMNSFARSELENNNVKIFTSVRDPIKRIFSLYNYVSFNEQHPHHKTVINRSPTEFVMRQPANFQFNFLKPNEESKLDDVYKIIDISPIENSITGLATFFDDNFNIKLEDLEIINKSIDLADGRNAISFDDIEKHTLDDLRKKHQIDFDLHKKSFD